MNWKLVDFNWNTYLSWSSWVPQTWSPKNRELRSRSKFFGGPYTNQRPILCIFKIHSKIWFLLLWLLKIPWNLWVKSTIFLFCSATSRRVEAMAMTPKRRYTSFGALDDLGSLDPWHGGISPTKWERGTVGVPFFWSYF